MRACFAKFLSGRALSVACGGLAFAQPGVQQLGKAADRGERGAEFVAHIGEEAGFELVGLFQRGIALAQRVLRMQVACQGYGGWEVSLHVSCSSALQATRSAFLTRHSRGSRQQLHDWHGISPLSPSRYFKAMY